MKATRRITAAEPLPFLPATIRVHNLDEERLSWVSNAKMLSGYYRFVAWGRRYPAAANFIDVTGLIK